MPPSPTAPDETATVAVAARRPDALRAGRGLRGGAWLAPLIVALRWGGVAVATVAATRAASHGDLVSVAGVGVVVFIAVWRTFVPLETRRGGLDLRGLYDVTIVAGIVIFTDVSAAVVWSLAATLFALVAPAILHHRHSDPTDTRTLTARLSRTYDLLRAVHDSVTTLTTSLEPRSVVGSIRDELRSDFGPTVICLLEHDGRSGVWVPRIAEGCVLRPSYPTQQLPAALRVVSTHGGSRRRNDLVGDGVVASSEGGLYAALRAGDEIVGVIALEHPDAERWTAADLEILEQRVDRMALQIADSRWLARLRAYGVEDERSRVEGGLQDRLGQWLTYVGFELDAIHQDAAELDECDEVSGAIARLRSQVDGALREVRTTVGRLETAVSTERPFAVAGAELSERFSGHGTTVTFEADPDAERLDVAIEQELLAILGAALDNAERHAGATRVAVTWTIRDGRATLEITDDGTGFDLAASVRDRASGLVAMQGGADSIGARLDIRSRPGAGTTIVVDLPAARWLTEPPAPSDHLFDTRIPTR